MYETQINDTVVVEQTCSLVVEIFTLVFYPLVMIVGLPGNCLILRVYWAKPFKTSTTVLIMGLAWADLFSCLFMIFRAASSCLLINRHIRPEYNGCTDLLLFTAIASSLMITSVIAFDRYDCVCRPQRRFFNRKRAHVAVVCCVFYSATINVAGIVELFAPSPLTGQITLVFQVLCFMSALFIIIICYRKVYITIRKHVKTGIIPQKAKTNIMVTSVIDGVQNSTPNTSSNLEDALDMSVHRIDFKKGTLTKQAWIHEPSSDVSTERRVTPANSISVLKDNFLIRERNILAANNAGTHASTSTLVTTSVKQSIRPAVNPIQASGEMPVSEPSPSADRDEKPPTVPKRPVTSLQRKTTRMLLITSVVFLISWLPRWAYVALLVVDQSPMVVVHPNVMLGVGLSSLLEYINHAINPFIYGFANRRFRKDCKIELQKLRC